MGRMYVASFQDIAVTAVQDLLTLTNAATTAIRMVRAEINQSGTLDYGDAQAEGIRVNWTRYATAGSGGSAVTPAKLATGDPASGVTAARNNTTQGGTATIILGTTWNVQAGWLWVPTPSEQIWVAPSAIIALALPTIPNDSLNMSGYITFEEVV